MRQQPSEGGRDDGGPPRGGPKLTSLSQSHRDVIHTEEWPSDTLMSANARSELNPAGSLAREEVPSAMAGRFPAIVCGGGATASVGLWGGKTPAWEGCFACDSQEPVQGNIVCESFLYPDGICLGTRKSPCALPFCPWALSALPSPANKATGLVAELARG